MNHLMTGGAAVVQSLNAHGVDTVFGIPGTHNLAIYEALHDVPSIRHIVARHEQGAAFMADGYARASGKEGVCFCTTGPAALNLLASMGTAYSDSIPLFAICSQIPGRHIGLEKGYLHECRDQLSCFRPVTKWCRHVDSVSEIPLAIQEAFRQMRTGRARPVAIEVPFDVLDREDLVTLARAQPVTHLEPAADRIDEAVRLLAAARRPCIWVGGGVVQSGATDALEELANKLQAPVFTTALGKGAIPDDHPLALGNTMLVEASREYLMNADLLLAVGTRFTELETERWQLPLPRPLIHVDIDASELRRNYPIDLGIVGDARLTLEALCIRCASVVSSANRGLEVSELRREIRAECERVSLDTVEIVDAIQRATPRNTKFACDLTVAVYWSFLLLRLYGPRSYFYPWGFCTLGFGLSAGIGAKLACPDHPVVVLTGDGGLLFNVQELATAAQLGLSLVVVVFNDNSYGVLKPQQEMKYGRSIGVDLKNPDFPDLARAFGVAGKRVHSVQELEAAIAHGLEEGGCWLIEMPCSLAWPTAARLSRMFPEARSEDRLS